MSRRITKFKVKRAVAKQRRKDKREWLCRKCERKITWWSIKTSLRMLREQLYDGPNADPHDLDVEKAKFNAWADDMVENCERCKAVEAATTKRKVEARMREFLAEHGYDEEQIESLVKTVSVE